MRYHSKGTEKMYALVDKETGIRVSKFMTRKGTLENQQWRYGKSTTKVVTYICTPEEEN